MTQFRLLLTRPAMLLALVLLLAGCQSTPSKKPTLTGGTIPDMMAAGEYDKAASIAEKMVKVTRSKLGKNAPEVAYALEILGAARMGQDRLDEAERVLNEALDVRKKAFGPNHPKTAAGYKALANLEQRKNRYGVARGHLNKAMRILEQQPGGHAAAAGMKTDLALIHHTEGRYPEAEKLYREVLAASSGGLGRAAALSNLAGVLGDMGRFSEAEPLLKESIAIRSSALPPDDPTLATSLNNLASLYYGQGRLDDAERLFHQVLTSRRKAHGSKHARVAETLNNLASIHKAQGRLRPALRLQDEAVEILDDIHSSDHPKLAASLNNLAGMQQDLGNLSRAETLQQRALKMRRALFGDQNIASASSLHNLASIYAAQGQHAKAEPLYRQAIDAIGKSLPGDHPEMARFLGNLAWSQSALGMKRQALNSIERAVAITRKRTDRMRLSGMRSKGGVTETKRSLQLYLTHLGIAGRLNGNLDKIFTTMQLIHATDTSNVVMKMAARFAAGNRGMQSSVRRYQDKVAAWQTLDKSLVSMLGMPPKQRPAGKVGNLRNQIAAVEKDLSRMESTLARQFPAYLSLARPTPVGLREMQRMLRGKEGILLFVSGEDEGYGLLIKKSGAKFQRVKMDKARLLAMTDRLRSFLAPDGADSLPSADAFPYSAAHTLYKDWAAPFYSELEGVDHLFVVTHGALQSIPMAVLTTRPFNPSMASGDDSDIFRNSPWFLKNHAFSYLPSASSIKGLRRMAGRSSARLPFVGIGDPMLADHPGIMEEDFAGLDDEALETVALRGLKATKKKGKAMKASAAQPLFTANNEVADLGILSEVPSLPETATELSVIAATMKSNKSHLYLRERATERAVREEIPLRNYRVLSFATHAMLPNELEGISEPGLILTPPSRASSRDDGVLTAGEITRLKLDADLVILSACNTAAGVPGAEGFSGLAKAFFHAGSRTVFVSYWAVVSEPTVLLTTRMLRKMVNEPKLGRAKAHRYATLSLLNDMQRPEYSHPTVWAPFVVVGEGGAQR
ncbi:MAG: CHAT domain-containing protein [Magnetococcales bacterium]|nr:CHAT domain-containing protein [Magnetococcales bacterium]